MSSSRSRYRHEFASAAQAGRAFRQKFRELRPRRYYLSACVRIATPCGHLDKWIAFHRGVGIEHFFVVVPVDLRNQGNVPGLDRKSPDVTLLEADARLSPSEQLTQTILGLRRITRWLAVLGTRDYLFSPRESDVRHVLVRFEACGGVVVHPADFPCDEGAANLREGTLRAIHLRKEELGDDPIPIINPLALKRIREGGAVELKYGRDCLDEGMSVALERPRYGRTANLLRINRYRIEPDGPTDDPRRTTEVALREDFEILSREPLSKSTVPKPPEFPASKGVDRLRAWGRATGNAVQEGRLALPRSRYLSLGMMFKDAAPYLVEWIEFHRLVGVEHFYLYDNASTDDPRSVLEPYRKAGLISLRDWPAGSSQKSCFDHCIKQASSETRWLGILDDDEFIFPTRKESLAKLLQSYEKFAGVGVPWHMFGSSGHRAAPEGLVTENFTGRAGALHALRKCIFDPARVSEFINVHHIRFGSGYMLVDEDGRRSPGTTRPRRGSEHFRLHHYYTKSYEEAKRKVERRGYLIPESAAADQATLYLEAAEGDAFNEVKDTSIHRYLPALKKAVACPGQV